MDADKGLTMNMQGGDLVIPECFARDVEAAANEAVDSLDRCIIGLPIHYVEADLTGLGALGPDAMAERLLGVLRRMMLLGGLSNRLTLSSATEMGMDSEFGSGSDPLCSGADR
jgi:hypothetical protein